MKKIIISTALLLVSFFAFAQWSTQLNSKGVKQTKEGKYEKAIFSFTKAIENKTDYVETYFNRAAAKTN